MTFLNASLLSGLLLAAIPVFLHFAMRARPRKIEFPALQLLRNRTTTNARRMRLRHLLLLLLRCLLVAGIVILVTRPSLPAARYGLLPREWGILGAVIAVSFAAFFWMSRNDRSGNQTLHQQQLARSRRRVWCLAGGLLAVMLTVAWPWWRRIESELSAPGSEITQNVPVAAVFILDNSLSMTYQFENRSRLKQAVEITSEHLGQLPAGSRVAVSGLMASEEIVFQADLHGARSRLESLQPVPLPGSFNRALRAAVQAQVDDRKRVQETAGTSGNVDLFAREICIVTDRSRTAWTYPDDSGLSDLLKEHNWLQVYIVDVSVEKPVNFSLSQPKLIQESATSETEISLAVSVARTAATDSATTIDAFLLNPDGTEIRVGRQSVKIDDAAAESVFSFRPVRDQPFVNGFLRLSTTDPLPIDDIRYFTVQVRPTPEILFISGKPDDSFYLKNVLQPDEATRAGQIYFRCTTATESQAAQFSFADYDVVCLMNCISPDPSLWTSLKTFLEAGGGVLIVTGSSDISVNRWQTPEAQSVLPGALLTQLNFVSEPATLKIADTSSSITRAFLESEPARAELSRAIFEKRWAVDPSGEATVLMQYVAPGNPPAMLSRRVGRGKCVLFTSAMDNLVNGGSLWNNLVIDNWSFLMLAEEILRDLTGASDLKCNLTAGQVAEFAFPSRQRFSQFLLRRPEGRQTRHELPLNAKSVLIDDAVDPGHYLIRPTESGVRSTEKNSPAAAESPGAAVAGAGSSPDRKSEQNLSTEVAFSVNIPEKESDLTPMSADQFAELCGPDRIEMVRNLSELEQAAKVGRLGIEVFPVIMGFVMFLLCAEHLMANYFYDEDPETSGPVRKTPSASATTP